MHMYFCWRFSHRSCFMFTEVSECCFLLVLQTKRAAKIPGFLFPSLIDGKCIQVWFQFAIVLWLSLSIFSENSPFIYFASLSIDLEFFFSPLILHTHVPAHTHPCRVWIAKFIPSLSFLFTFFFCHEKVCFCQYFPLLHLDFESYFRKFAQWKIK